MLSNVFLKTLRDMRVALAWWAGGLFIVSLWMVTFFPSIEEATGFVEYMENLPDSIKVLIGEATTISTLEGFLSIELFSFFYPAMTIAFALTFGGSLISREEDEGTLDLLLSNPIPRWRVALEKFAALVVFTAIVLAASYLGLLAGAAVINTEADAGRLLEGTLAMLALTLFFAGLALCLTGLKRGRGLATGVSAGLAVVTYFTYTLKAVTDLPEWTQKLSPWYYYAGDTVLTKGIDWSHFWLLLGLMALLVALGTWGFQQRDLGT